MRTYYPSFFGAAGALATAFNPIYRPSHNIAGLAFSSAVPETLTVWALAGLGSLAISMGIRHRRWNVRC